MGHNMNGGDQIMSAYHQLPPAAAASPGTGTLAHVAASLGIVIAAATLIMAAFAGRRLVASVRQHKAGGAHRRAMLRPAVVFSSLVLAGTAASGTAMYLRAHPETITVTRLVPAPARTAAAASAQRPAKRPHRSARSSQPASQPQAGQAVTRQSAPDTGQPSPSAQGDSPSAQPTYYPTSTSARPTPTQGGPSQTPTPTPIRPTPAPDPSSPTPSPTQSSYLVPRQATLPGDDPAPEPRQPGDRHRHRHRPIRSNPI
jgi:hypothetical protein